MLKDETINQPNRMFVQKLDVELAHELVLWNKPNQSTTQFGIKHYLLSWIFWVIEMQI